jgi:mannose-6-phosphate isomerase-like protein (cupin superfamily)
MIYVKSDALPAILAGDHTILKELLHPNHLHFSLPFSLASACLPPGSASLPHRLEKSTETYYILSGSGQIVIEGIVQPIETGDLVLVPANALQYVINRGATEMSFLCIVSPPWSKEEEVVYDQPMVQ